ncbi:MAG: hypothetical protein F6K26_25640, partial [Moorea sp. SIO2I5]|nr:hypothetical protein [Moorena sp. SIO2I5]
MPYSLFPIPYYLFPITYYLLPITCSLCFINFNPDTVTISDCIKTMIKNIFKDILLSKTTSSLPPLPTLPPLQQVLRPLGLAVALALSCLLTLTGCHPNQFKTQAAQVSQLVLATPSDPATFNAIVNTSPFGV